MGSSEYLVSQELLDSWYSPRAVHWVWQPTTWDDHEGEWEPRPFRPTHKIEILKQGRALASDLVVLDPPFQGVAFAFTPQKAEDNPEERDSLAHVVNGCWKPMTLLREWQGAEVLTRKTVWVTDTSLIGWVYFIREGVQGPIKIGWSKSPEARIAALQTANPNPLVLLGKIPGPMEEERRIHSIFDRDRIQGEWFRPSPVLLSFVRGKFPMAMEVL